MPKQKDLKRLVRARMLKTGEAYTTARSHLLDNSHPSRKRAAPGGVTPSAPENRGPEVGPSLADLAQLAGMSDEAVEAKTGCGWSRWVRALDRLGAAELSHRDIARLVEQKYRVTGWWAQTVTVGYERIRGLREPGQRRGGLYEASRSRTFAVPVAKLYRAFNVRRIRERWLPEPVAIRTSTRDRSMRITWGDGTDVYVHFTSRTPMKSTVQIQHSKLPDRESIDSVKAFWGERLNALGAVLGTASRETALEARHTKR